jgi:hypothetical protein
MESYQNPLARHAVFRSLKALVKGILFLIKLVLALVATPFWLLLLVFWPQVGQSLALAAR